MAGNGLDERALCVILEEDLPFFLMLKKLTRLQIAVADSAVPGLPRASEKPCLSEKLDVT